MSEEIPSSSTTCGSSPAPRAPRGHVGRRVHGRASPASSGASRIGVAGADRPVELPAHDGDLEDRSRARDAGTASCSSPSELHAADGAQDGRARRGPLPAGRLQRRSPGDGEPVGDALVRHPDVGIVSLTGDVDTGKLIATNAADTLKRVHLELGGKAPVIVFDDADIDTAVEWIKIAGYFNAGQDCTAACRVLVGSALRQRCCPSWCPRSSRSRWATRSTTSTRDGRGHLAGAARARRRVRRPRAGGRRLRPHRRRGDGPRRASSTSRRSWPTSSRTPRSSRRRSSAPS